MSIEMVVGLATALLGSGGVWAYLTSRNARKLGLSKNETTAKRDLNDTWENIVKALQDGQAIADRRLNVAFERMEEMDSKYNGWRDYGMSWEDWHAAGYPDPPGKPKRPI